MKEELAITTNMLLNVAAKAQTITETPPVSGCFCSISSLPHALL
jgi:hypothetical protein